MALEPLGDPLDRRDLPCPAGAPQAAKAPQLALEVAVGPPEAVQAGRSPVERVELDAARR